MGNTLNKGINGEENEPQTDLNAILKSIGSQVNHILQNQNKNLESIRQSLNEQTNYLKAIADNIIKSPVQFSQNKLGDIQNINEQKPIQMIEGRIFNQKQGKLEISSMHQRKANWKQAVCIKGKKGSWRLIDATKQQNSKDYDNNLNLFIKTKEMKKINLSENGLTDINQIIKQKNIIELNLNSNLLQKVIIPIQSLIKLQINNNLLVDADLSSLPIITSKKLNWINLLNFIKWIQVFMYLYEVIMKQANQLQLTNNVRS